MSYKDIPGYEGLYLISKKGDVKSMYSGRILSQGKSTNGYKNVTLVKDKIKKCYSVHRLMGFTYLELDDSDYVCHKDDIRSNNNLENLFIGSQSDNIKDAVKKGRHFMQGRKGSLHPNSRIIRQLNKDGKFIKEWHGAGEIQRELGFAQQNILSCCKGLINSSKGFIWKYL